LYDTFQKDFLTRLRRDLAPLPPPPVTPGPSQWGDTTKTLNVVDLIDY